ncbi:hypothetical protein Q7C_366 [Methylophaga frappieri]|uniref:Uncharacterized protein n=1 Tax=Methylophaga frappieri (strain ATCC BAA-2434 / DSM 25690 / JAM7) TaxID=754477 RepID=I1YF48_METFJ|nr:hypothetical protein Q7C_366 [Methylophaga frappieri]
MKRDIGVSFLLTCLSVRQSLGTPDDSYVTKNALTILKSMAYGYFRDWVSCFDRGSQ